MAQHPALASGNVAVITGGADGIGQVDVLMSNAGTGIHCASWDG